MARMLLRADPPALGFYSYRCIGNGLKFDGKYHRKGIES